MERRHCWHHARPQLWPTGDHTQENDERNPTTTSEVALAPRASLPQTSRAWPLQPPSQQSNCSSKLVDNGLDHSGTGPPQRPRLAASLAKGLLQGGCLPSNVDH
eukprot:5579665-Amphidinium_carterae.1